MKEPIEIMETEDRLIEIYGDEYPESPRDWDNLGTMVCGHKRYELGDEQIKWDGSYHNVPCYSWDDVEKVIESEEGSIVSLPIYIYDHSGVALSTSPFSDPWDSGRVGVIYVSHECLKREFGYKRVTQKLIKKAREILKSEVEIYSHYVNGEVYGYVAVCKFCGEEIDSCWGFYGWDHKSSGLMYHAMEGIHECTKRNYSPSTETAQSAAAIAGSRGIA